MRYYRVKAKCGHVGGRKNYIDINFYTIAESGSEAAAFIRKAPRVKHHHKDAIRSVEEISAAEYQIGKSEYENDPYIQCKNKQQQNTIWYLISTRVMPEKICNNFNRVVSKEPNPKRSLKYGYFNDRKMDFKVYLDLMDLEWAC